SRMTAGSLPDVLTLAPDPKVVGTLYAGSSVGLYKNVNGGATWTLSANGLPRFPVKAIVVDPKNTNVVYAGTFIPSFTGTVYKSADVLRLSDAGELPDSGGHTLGRRHCGGQPRRGSDLSRKYRYRRSGARSLYGGREKIKWRDYVE